jgi:hypothetical protein
VSPELPDVFAIIVTYNNESDIRGCLSGLLVNKNSCNLRICVIDNASSDNTISVINAFKSRHVVDKPDINLTANKSNLGFTVALNQGLKRCEQGYILVLNPDAALKEGCLRTLIAASKGITAAGVVAPQLLNPDGSIQPSCRRFPRRRDLIFELAGLSYLFPQNPRFNYWKMGDFNHNLKRDVDQPQGACLFFSKKILDQVGLWDEAFPMFFSDVDWCARVKKSGCKIIFEPAAKAAHKKGASINRNRIKMIISSHKSFALYLKRYRPNFILVNQIFAIILWLTAFVRIFVFLAEGLFSKHKSEATNGK